MNGANETKTRKNTHSAKIRFKRGCFASWTLTRPSPRLCRRRPVGCKTAPRGQNLLVRGRQVGVVGSAACTSHAGPSVRATKPTQSKSKQVPHPAAVGLLLWADPDRGPRDERVLCVEHELRVEVAGDDAVDDVDGDDLLPPLTCGTKTRQRRSGDLFAVAARSFSRA